MPEVNRNYDACMKELEKDKPVLAAAVGPMNALLSEYLKDEDLGEESKYLVQRIQDIVTVLSKLDKKGVSGPNDRLLKKFREATHNLKRTEALIKIAEKEPKTKSEKALLKEMKTIFATLGENFSSVKISGNIFFGGRSMLNHVAAGEKGIPAFANIFAEVYSGNKPKHLKEKPEKIIKLPESRSTLEAENAESQTIESMPTPEASTQPTQYTGEAELNALKEPALSKSELEIELTQAQEKVSQDDIALKAANEKVENLKQKVINVEKEFEATKTKVVDALHQSLAGTKFEAEIEADIKRVSRLSEKASKTGRWSSYTSATDPLEQLKEAKKTMQKIVNNSKGITHYTRNNTFKNAIKLIDEKLKISETELNDAQGKVTTAEKELSTAQSKQSDLADKLQASKNELKNIEDKLENIREQPASKAQESPDATEKLETQTAKSAASASTTQAKQPGFFMRILKLLGQERSPKETTETAKSAASASTTQEKQSGFFMRILKLLGQERSPKEVTETAKSAQAKQPGFFMRILNLLRGISRSGNSAEEQPLSINTSGANENPVTLGELGSGVAERNGGYHDRDQRISSLQAEGNANTEAKMPDSNTATNPGARGS